MATNSYENELVDFMYSLLNGDSELKTQTGIAKTTQAKRNVAVFAEVDQDQPVPYVRITLTDTVLIDDQPFEYDYVPTAKTVSLMVTAFSDYEKEIRAIASRLEILLQHTEITTPHFHGNTWLTGVQFYTDNTSSTKHIYRCAGLRVRVDLEPI